MHKIISPSHTARACSSVGEHYLDTVGVVGSIPTTHTMKVSPELLPPGGMTKTSILSGFSFALAIEKNESPKTIVSKLL
jgi:hypothetical protein